MIIALQIQNMVIIKYVRLIYWHMTTRGTEKPQEFRQKSLATTT